MQSEERCFRMKLLTSESGEVTALRMNHPQITGFPV